jgi:CheY-like chemotaxis protein
MGDLRGMRILLVDDNATNRKILHYQVSAWGMRDSVASSGPGALALLREGAARGDPYAVVILDAHMPELKDHQVVELIRNDPSVAAVKIVLLTSVEPGGLPPDLSNQVDAIISKPAKQSQLFESLCHVIGIGTDSPEVELTKSEPVFSTLHEKKLRVLLAEDNPVNQRVVLYQLRMLDQQVDLAQDGVEALKLFDEHEYDVILMDIHMPRLDGYSATGEIRRREEERKAKHTWIIAVTANALPEDRDKCLAAGMDDYLAKPVKARALVYALEKCVKVESLPPATDLRLLVDSGIGDMVPQLISVFLESAPRDIEKMRLALGAKDPDGLGGAAHSLKGSCSNLGASRLRDLCQQIENHGRSGSLGEVFKLLESVDQEFGRVNSELNVTRNSLVGIKGEALG